ncbi:MAG TPA: prolipoprotein diacylglyceryl transferase [Leptospiraceae bacterium]|nr:prolipoprotein diacylglyceryl transferase [Leptospiraceae bacterium]
MFSPETSVIFHLIFETAGFLIGFQYYLHLRKKEKDLLTEKERYWILISVITGALIFSRFIAVMEHLDQIGKDTPLAFYYGQKTIVGGLLGGLLFTEIIKKILNIKYSSGDMMTYPIITGIAIGRVGCFLSGINDGTHGLPSSVFWAIDFGDGIGRHPVQIYEIVFLILLFIFLKGLESLGLKYKEKPLNESLKNPSGFSVLPLFWQNGILKNGMKFRIFLFSYLLFRFFSEFIKPVSVFAIGISFIQISCLCGMFYFIWKTASELREDKFSA